MKRMHIHMGVDQLDQSIKFYSALFGVPPTKENEDYARWLLDDPCINFAISTKSGKQGVDHFGIQVEEEAELEALRAQLKAADLSLFDEGETVCCYARSEKSWVEDPSGIPWEAYNTMEETALFGSSIPGDTAASSLPETRGLQATDVTELPSGCCG